MMEFFEFLFVNLFDRAIGSVHEYVNQNPVFGFLNSDSVFHTGLPVAVVAGYSGTVPELAKAEFSHGELVVTVPNDVDLDWRDEVWSEGNGIGRLCVCQV
ncbi:hypothetical protein Hanom_Chr12g01093401 [Helianthus anomalus]